MIVSPREALAEIGCALFLAVCGRSRWLRRLAGWPDETEYTEYDIVA